VKSHADKGFTLLEVMVALAIMAGVILTLLGSVNYHLGVISRERDSTTLTLLARARLDEMERAQQLQKGEGSMAPDHPELTWRAELFETPYPGVRKLVLMIRRAGDRQEVTLVRYVLK
jgi:general secretion pathway protein I